MFLWPIMVKKEQPGYVLNSLLVPLLDAGSQLWANEIADPETIDKTWMIATGAPAGPFAIMDTVGLNTVYETVVATNSSTLLPSAFAEATGRPEKFLAYHFANEIWKNNTAEIMPHPGTAPELPATFEEYSREIGMVARWEDGVRRDLQATDEQIAAAREHLTYVTDLGEALAGADLVIEALPEAPATKTEFYEKFAKLADPQA
ncbi:hypothetical protein H7R52_01990 [Weissella confusa]|uniref:3-hydroxyacyl-CoA dehydrogenase NAD binding domain-containing protein n=1 Tax=Weissella confusa TaxID=1583 RepID=A0A923SMU3_WEICO|nr:hypothetical protein [Weissella confusa]